MVEFRGSFSAFKSTVTTLLIASHQAKYPGGMCGLIDLEKDWDPDYGLALGVDLSRLVVCNPDSGEQALDVTADLTGVDAECLTVFNSIAAAVPTQEMDASADQQFMGLHPRLINKLMRVVTARMRRSLYDSKASKFTPVFVNQLREKIGVMFGDPETTPGGKGKDFFYSTRVKFRAPKGERIQKEVERNGIKKKITMARKVFFEIDKNKASADQFAEGEFIWHQRPFGHYERFTADNDAVLLEYGLFHGVINPCTGGYRISNGIELPKKWEKAVKALSKRPKTMALVMREILEAKRKEQEEGFTT
jgi:protein RecA